MGETASAPASRGPLTEALALLPHPLALLDGDGRVVVANAAFAELIHRPAEEVPGARLHDLVDEGTATVDDLLRRWRASGSPRPGSLTVTAGDDRVELRCDGARLRSEPLTLVRAREKQRVVRPFTELSRDIETRSLREMRRRLEASLEELRVANRRLAASNEELDRYAQVVSHDLRSPLATITGFVDLLLAAHADDLDPEAREALAAIQRAAQRMNDVTGALLRLARVGDGAVSTDVIDPADVVAEAVEQIRAELDAVGGRVETGDLHEVEVDRTHLLQVLQNLVTNSVKFRSPERALRVRISSEQRGGWVVFTVADNGRGVRDEEAERIFGILERGADARGTPGAGIGLATCRKIVDLYGGEIRREPTDGPGARFVFTLPAAQGDT